MAQVATDSGHGGPVTPWAFNPRTNPPGARLRATLGSDMGHWDVSYMRRVLPEELEMVERGVLDQDDFRRFTFEHPFEFFSGVNPEFFAGTKVEALASTACGYQMTSGERTRTL